MRETQNLAQKFRQSVKNPLEISNVRQINSLMPNIIKDYDAYLKRKENYQPNAITLSQHEFSMVERKLLIFCINQIDFRNARSDKSMVFKIPVKELDTNYTRLDKICEEITRKKMRSLDKDGFGVIVPFPEARYFLEKGLAYVELTMFSNVVPIFIGLKTAYTSYNFETMLQIQSMYAQRMLEILMMEIKGRRKYVFNYFLEDLQFILGSDYDNYADLRRRVLEPARVELAEKADLIFDYYIVGKAGRKVVEIQFAVKTRKQVATEELDNDIYHWSLLDRENLIATTADYLDKYRFTFNQKNKILKDDKLLRKFMLLHTQIRTGELTNVHNPTAYIAQSLGWGRKK